MNIPKIAKLINQMKLTVPGDDNKLNMMNGIMNLGLFIENKVEQTLLEIVNKKRNLAEGEEEEEEKTISGVMSSFKAKHKIGTQEDTPSNNEMPTIMEFSDFMDSPTAKYSIWAGNSKNRMNVENSRIVAPNMQKKTPSRDPRIPHNVPKQSPIFGKNKFKYPSRSMTPDLLDERINNLIMTGLDETNEDITNDLIIQKTIEFAAEFKEKNSDLPFVKSMVTTRKKMWFEIKTVLLYN